MPYPNYKSLRILIVDDFDNFRVTIAKLLQSLGVPTVDMALNGTQAVKACRSRQYDVVLCDFNLGQGKTGQQVLEELRKERYLPHSGLFAFVSAESSRGVVLASNEFEPDGYFTKPITGKALQQRLERMLIQRDALLPALRAIDDRDYDAAISHFQELINTGSRYATICKKRLGELYLLTENFELAEIMYEQLLEDGRKLDWAVIGMAKAKQGQNEWDAASKMLRELILENPLSMAAYDVLSKDYDRLGDTWGKQQLLQKAVKMSPLSLKRNKSLAHTALQNNDVATSAAAFRKTARLGNNSCNDELESHLEFGRTAAAMTNEDHSDESRDFLRDALLNLEGLDRKFELSENEKLQTILISSRIYSSQGNRKKAQESLQQAENFMHKGRRQDFNTEFDKVNALFSMGEDVRAKEALGELVRLYEDDQDALRKLDILLDEPLSEANREKVKAVNHEGISYYKNHQYEDAINCFAQAKQLFPNHVGILLNLVQAYTGHIKAFGFNTERMEQCELVLKHVESKLSGSHPQIDRFRQLKDICRNISQGGRARG